MGLSSPSNLGGLHGVTGVISQIPNDIACFCSGLNGVLLGAMGLSSPSNLGGLHGVTGVISPILNTESSTAKASTTFEDAASTTAPAHIFPIIAIYKLSETTNCFRGNRYP